VHPALQSGSTPPVLHNLPVNPHGHILKRHHIPELDHLMLFPRQFSPSAWLHPILLNGLKYPSIQFELHHPQTPTPRALQPQFLTILIQRDFLAIHKLHSPISLRPERTAAPAA
jgi:hypothetical protein